MYGRVPYDESKHPRARGGKFAVKPNKKQLRKKPKKGQQDQQPLTPAWNGEVQELQTKLTKQEAGALGEKIAIAFLQKAGLAPDARPLNLQESNFPVDLIGDHMLVEVKTGLVSNSKDAQQWRATIGQPGKAETAWLRTASAEEKAAWNEQKKQAIMDRKLKVLKDMSNETGVKLEAKTMTLILDPDKKLADVYLFNGFHHRIGWRSPLAKTGYQRTIRYA